MQAPRERLLGYSTTAPRSARTAPRALLRSLDPKTLGVHWIVLYRGRARSCRRPDQTARLDRLSRAVALVGAVNGAVVCEQPSDANDFAAEHRWLCVDGLVFDLSRHPENAGNRPDRHAYGTDQPRSARTENSIVLIACSPCVPPAALTRDR